MKRYLTVAVVFFVCGVVRADEVTGSQPLRIVITPSGQSGIYEYYLPRTASCTTNDNEALSYSNAEWNQTDNVAKATYLMGTYRELNARHGFNYSERIMTCNAYRESKFRTQIDTAMSGSSARGLNQVVLSTAEYLFAPRGEPEWGFGFQSKLRGFEGLNGQQAYDQMCGSMLLQMEMGLAVVHMKSRENGNTDNGMKLMAAYYGDSTNHCCSELFGRAVYNCAACIQRNGNVPTQACLDMAEYPFAGSNCEQLSTSKSEFACYPDGLPAR